MKSHGYYNIDFSAFGSSSKTSPTYSYGLSGSAGITMWELGRQDPYRRSENRGHQDNELFIHLDDRS